MTDLYPLGDMMLQVATRSVPAFVPEALAASQVGTWEYEAAADRLRCDNTMADLYGLTRVEAANGVPISRISAVLHPEDRGRGRQKRELMLERGGMFVMEYRIVANGAIRWVLVRGHYERNKSGSMIGRGIIIDITDCKHDGHLENEVFFVAPNEDLDPLDRAAHHAIKARQAIDMIKGTDSQGLRQIVNMLLLIIGRVMAKKIYKNDYEYCNCSVS